MPNATYVQSSFAGGQWSKFAQGRYHDPKYRTALNVALNVLPTETENCVRRPGTAFAQTTRNGNPGRVFTFDFEDETAPYTGELTDGHLRFRQGTTLVNTNDSVGVSSISGANPAVMALAAAVTWGTGDQGYFVDLAGNPLIENRIVQLTKVDTTHFSLTDPITGSNINGASLAAIGAGVTFNRILDIATPFIGGSWASGNMVVVQGDAQSDVESKQPAFLLTPNLPPYAITVEADPTPSSFATFNFGLATFEDGPYQNPFTNGAQVTPNGLSGIVQLTLSFQAWSPFVSYADGDLVSSGSVNYQSQEDENVGSPITCTFTNSSASISATNSFVANQQVAFFPQPVAASATPGSLPSNLTAGTVYFVLSSGLSSSAFEVSATSGGSAITMSGAGSGTLKVALAPASMPAAWSATSAAVAINNGNGFQQTDIGRLERLFSEPALWSPTASYSEGNVVSYNPSGLPGQTTYWQSLTSSNVNKAPGTDTTNWEILAQGGTSSPAIWTWGKITGLINTIPNAPSGVAYIGDMTSGGGLSAAFNGNTTQSAAACAQKGGTYSGPLTSYVGENFSGCSTTSYGVQSATVYPSSDQGLVHLQNAGTSSPSYQITGYLYGKNGTPGSDTDGTLLGSTTISGTVPSDIEYFLVTSPLNIQSANQSAFSDLWVVVETIMTGSFLPGQLTVTHNIAQVQYVEASGAGTSANGVELEILGAPLLYTSAIRTWRLGLYSGTTGYPTCGTNESGRIWLGGSQANRVDACVANGVTSDALGTTLNFAPTDQYGNVLDSSAIAIVINLPEANPIKWMIPDQQGILCGTKAREALIFPPTAGGFSPTNIDARKLTRIGSAAIQPVQTEHTILFVQKFLRKIVEYFADVFSGKFTAPNLIQDAKNLTVGGLQELAYQQELAPLVWARVNNALIGCTYKRDTLMTSSGPTMNGWHPHTLGSGRDVESICAGSSIDGNLDALTLATNDTTANIRFVEVLTDILDEGSTPAQAKYLDAQIVPTSTGAASVVTHTPAQAGDTPYGGLVLNGLWPLNGKTVTAWLGGLDCGDYTVTNGSITVPYGDGIAGGEGAFPLGCGGRTDQGLFTANFVSTGITANNVTMFTGTMPMLVGFTFTSRGQLCRPIQPQDTGSRNGPAFAKLARDHYLMALLEGANGASFGTSFTSTIVPLESAMLKINEVPLTADQQFTGVFRDQFESDYDFDAMPCWQVTRPYICNVQAFGAARETADV